MQPKNKRKKYSTAYLQKLAQKVLDGTATEAEKLFLDEYYDFFDHKRNSPLDLNDLEKQMLRTEMRERLQKDIESNDHGRARLFFFYKIAASVSLLLIASVILYNVMGSSDKSTPALTDSGKKDEPITHGGSKAILTLDDGTRILLNDKSNSRLAIQAGYELIANAHGELAYARMQPTDEKPGERFNTLQTPRGGIYQITLPDGTKVWLNSSTTLRYPLAFAGNERRVELTGEAYFEVFPNKKAPFCVVGPRETVEVLGTHFNINAYEDEVHPKITLLEGRVKVISTASGKSAFLSPGQQAAIRTSGIKIKQVEAENAVAWKDGLFQFDNENIYTVMRKIARWYDIDVEYSGEFKDLRFGGSVSRFEDIQKVLRKLELTNTIHFKIEGRKIIVMK